MKTAYIHPRQKTVKKGYSQAEIETFSRILQTTIQRFTEEQTMVHDTRYGHLVDHFDHFIAGAVRTDIGKFLERKQG